jgi:amino acid transporter
LNSIFTIGDLSTSLVSVTGYPFIDLFYNATKSKAAATVMTVIVVINFTASGIAVMATASRQIWAFARSKGLPFSTWFAPV